VERGEEFETAGSDPALSIVVPAYNEADRLETSLGRLIEVLWNGLLDAWSTEVILVDDGSSDATYDLAARILAPLPRSEVIRLPGNRGKGAAVRAGVARATGAAIAFLDADMSVDPACIPDLVASLDDLDVAIGSRATDGSVVDCRSVRRMLMGRAFNRFATALTGVSTLDTQCGFKAFRAPVARLLFHLAVTDRFAFDVELLDLAQSLGLSIGEVPVRWKHVPGSHIRPIYDPLTMIADVARSRALHRSAQVRGFLVFRGAGRETPGSGSAASFASSFRRQGAAEGVESAGMESESMESESMESESMESESMETVASLRKVVRHGDLVIPWGSAAMVLMPLRDATEQEAAKKSLLDRLPGWSVETASVRFDQLLSLSPLSGRIVYPDSASGRGSASVPPPATRGQTSDPPCSSARAVDVLRAEPGTPVSDAADAVANGRHSLPAARAGT